jgi:hypothetical protein
MLVVSMVLYWAHHLAHKMVEKTVHLKGYEKERSMA